MSEATLEFFRARAAECQRLADEMSDPKAKEIMLFVASRWLAMVKADEERAARLRKPCSEGQQDPSE
jgi:hypothetical protein